MFERTFPAGFIAPCLPTKIDKMPSGGQWRRYALFTLVGIAGEDDLDAPDLSVCAPAAGGEPRQSQDGFVESGNARGRGGAKNKRNERLDPAKSVALRDRLLTEVTELRSTRIRRHLGCWRVIRQK
jgi:hypothetical protein